MRPKTHLAQTVASNLLRDCEAAQVHLRPGQRDTLPPSSVGGSSRARKGSGGVLSQFLDRADPNAFVWLRG